MDIFLGYWTIQTAFAAGGVLSVLLVGAVYLVYRVIRKRRWIREARAAGIKVGEDLKTLEDYALRSMRLIPYVATGEELDKFAERLELRRGFAEPCSEFRARLLEAIRGTTGADGGQTGEPPPPGKDSQNQEAEV